MSNRLADETSPYLRQHADNPVDWWPWGEAALAAARSGDRPILLSVGYSACHWCHVMAHESFEDPAVAALMNRHFINIKVDREERPDVDAIYMQAVQAMTGQGGWPMTVFMTPEGVPFYGGTYFPPTDRHGLPGFSRLVEAMAEVYRTRKDAVARTGDQIRERLVVPRLEGGADPHPGLLDAAVASLVAQTDRRDGGFGPAPKFPHPAAVDLLLRRVAVDGDAAAWEAAVVTLDHMARGGVYDQLGGGFHRYSVDGEWAVPHFEKMLYDNALLAPVYLHAWQLSGDERWARVVRETLAWAEREMLLPGGGFASSQDADSEGEEGRFFSWTPAQLTEVLGEEDGRFAAGLFGVTADGNFEHGATVLALPVSLDEAARSLGLEPAALRERFDGVRLRLAAAREQRIHPDRDDKVLASWNALMLAAFAECGAAFGDEHLLDVARRCAGFLLRELRPRGRVLRTWKDGRGRIPGFLEDVAFMADALITLYAADGDPRWFDAAVELAAELARYRDTGAGFHDTAADAEPLLVRPRTLDDNPIPAGQSKAAVALLRLAALTDDGSLRDAAMEVVRPLAPAVARSPLALANLAVALDLATASPREVAIVGPRDSAATRALVAEVHRRYLPRTALAWGDPGRVPLLAGRPLVAGAPAAYVCSGFTCAAPVTAPVELAAQLGGAVAPR